MLFLAFLGSVAVASIAFEIMNGITQPAISSSSLAPYGASEADLTSNKHSTLDAILLAIWPERFDPMRSKSLPDVIDMLRRSGYPYETPGEFYASAIRDFILFLLVGSGLAAAMMILGLGFAGPLVAAIFIFLGLRHPYARLKMLARKRAEGMVSNMLIGLTVMETLIASSVSVDETLRAVGSLGGPFCNLMALLLAQKNIRSSEEAITVVEQHLPDPQNTEVQLFLRDIRMEFSQQGSGGLGQSVHALRQSLHRSVVEATETRAALVRQRAGLFGVLAVLGLVLTIILPYMGMAF